MKVQLIKDVLSTGDIYYRLFVDDKQEELIYGGTINSINEEAKQKAFKLYDTTVIACKTAGKTILKEEEI